MDILPFVNRNGLWYLDKRDFLEPHILGHAPLVMAQRGIAEFLDELAGGIFSKLDLEFSDTPISHYDAKLVKVGARYKCVSLLGKRKELVIWLPPPIF